MLERKKLKSRIVRKNRVSLYMFYVEELKFLQTDKVCDIKTRILTYFYI